MPDLHVENYCETDSSDNEENHSKLLNSVSQLDSTQRVKPAERKEAASEVSEFNLSQGPSIKKNLVHVKELVTVLGKKAEHGSLTKKIKKVIERSRTLPKPLNKPVEEKLKRLVGFENVKEQLRRWDAVVVRNALKDQITFPLNDGSIKKQKSSEFLSQFKTPTPLEKEMAKVLKQEIVEEIETEDNEFPLTFEEMMEKRKEMAQIRAKLSYKQSKAQRQSKIKSKKYHRLLKREKLKQQLKEFEVLQKTNPEAALKKLSELDKTRAQERASLRHRNTGQWAKNLTVKAKYDVETRKVLADQLKISQELTQKVSQVGSSEDDEPADSAVPNNLTLKKTTHTSSTANPWVLDVSQEVQDFVSGYKKFWSEKGTEINQDESKTDKKENTINKNVSCEEKNESNDKSITKCNFLNQNTEISEKGTEIDHDKSKRNKKENDNNKNESNKEKKESNNDKCNTKSGFLNQNKEISEGNNEIQKRKKIRKKTNSLSASSKKIFKERRKIYVSVHPTSGVWIVTPIIESDAPVKKIIKNDDIDTLFDELNDRLMKGVNKKISKIKKKIKKSERIKKMKNEKKESNKDFDVSLKNRNVIERPDMDVGLLENGVENQVLETLTNDDKSANPVNDVKSNYEPAIIDPNNFIQVKPKRLKTHLPENITGDEEGLDDEKAQQSIIEEAFGEDDVMAEFKEMKKQEEKKSKIEIEKSLPGWGKWGGTGIKQKTRKKRFLILNRPPRKDKNKKDVIINENENPKLRNHLVKEVPHPFKSVDAFEANIRAPIGRNWIPETAHQKLVQKQVVTKLGTVIEPMSEEEIVRLKKESKSPYQGIKNKN